MVLQSPPAILGAGQVVEVRIIKSTRRRIFEVLFYAWGVLGMAGCLLAARLAAEYDESVSGIFQMTILYTLIWIGGLVFVGLFALLAPVKVFLVSGGTAPEKPVG
jgi:hypothetical protein